ncbi:MAG: hypothetical protein H6815_03275 [Phycisphaeraceae bacterium]|nr:hypothetical protein [Phycisphaerales bacterium]MCB9859449.1 hypothetical protein [Phycisphaeraceae bacterium]
MLHAEMRSGAYRVPVVGSARASNQFAKWCASWDRRGDSVAGSLSQREMVRTREDLVDTTAHNAQAHTLTQFFAEAKHDQRAVSSRPIERRTASAFGTHIPGRHAQARSHAAGLASAYSATRTAQAAQSLAEEQDRFEDALSTMSSERQALVRRVRAQVLNGGYDTESKLDAAMDGAIDDMLEHFDRNSRL